MPSTVTPEMQELLDTQALLQGAHDYVEAYGFDIMNYGETDEHGHARCYIGTLRGVAGVVPSPQGAYGQDVPPDHGDGPELTRAFKILDKIAQREVIEDEHLRRVRGARPRWRRGRWIEALGFQKRAAGYGDSSQAMDALRIFRKALTKVHRDIEKLKGATDA